jgi:hypothetical protein
MKQNELPLVFVYITVGVFTILAGSIACYLSVQPHLSLEQAQIFDTCNQICQSGAAAMLTPLYLKFLP